ncbi:excinuclease ABC subunit A [Xylanibacillus composti]|uniref:UvrABC system protein A n=1 Tax=Xylanibacillus composti TaxID=1572762 RepID=A0A8J4H5V3_9BACL|nr:excinuclease ABC subunit UvrA [Xylanibacillus composti]MDT9724872.1 excinuclease ABC subunit A [Xylanibacillus composti]GIQ69033.1 excinuclease ABC subunit A [Xylanibacillus composti]
MVEAERKLQDDEGNRRSAGNDVIEIRGARENNLQNVTLRIPKHQLVVLTGPSGSGKSTLALDTLQRECQRQYMESMGMAAESYAKPKVDAIIGLSPSISVGQHVTNRNPRSTVGTVTDIHPYLRIVYEKLGERACQHCGQRFVPGPLLDAGMADDEELDAHTDVPALHCPHCAGTLRRYTRRHFSYNTPEGACEACGGLGHTLSLDLDAVFDQTRSLQDGGVRVWIGALIQYQTMVLNAAAEYYGLDFDPVVALKDYDEPVRDLLYYGVESDAFSRHFPDCKPPKTVNGGKFEGVVTGIWRRYKEKAGDSGEAALFHEQACEACRGARLKEEVRSITVQGVSFPEISSWSLQRASRWLGQLRDKLPDEHREQTDTLLHDMALRLERIVDVGLGYLTLNRQSVSLSGGEAQRLRLASVLGSGLTGVLYILDEPSSGLHPRDTQGLIRILKQLRDLGNTVLVIEHDIEMMRAADHVIDMGPGAGSGGGRVVGEGTLLELTEQADSVTGAYLRNIGARKAPWTRRSGNGKRIVIRDAHARNLKHVHVSLPLGCLTAVTGVSGSGKSTLLFDLVGAGDKEAKARAGCGSIEGLDAVDGIVNIDQSPIGRMSRSNVATYTDVFTAMRNLYASLPEAKKNGLTAKHFSFNTAGGRCEHCQGLGTVPLDLFFLSGMEVRCPVCRGKRFKEDVLRVTYQGLSISDMLNLTVEESLGLFAGHSKIERSIRLLHEVGLGYLQWGQAITTLSGGEGQRLRLAKELNVKAKQHLLYLLDEPTTGLHPQDTAQLVRLLHRLVDAGHTVIVVEHNMELIRECDWIIDMGPEGGDAGGEVIAEGTPEQVALADGSHTATFLRKVL